MIRYHKELMVSVAVVLLICSVTLIPTGVCSNGTIIYVDDDNITGPWDGSLQHPYRYIQDGVDAATLNDTVYVFSGFYEENVVINTSLRLIGEEKETTIVDGMNHDHVLLISADTVTIDGFTVQNSGSSQGSLFCGGITIESDCNQIIENIIHTNNAHGVFVDSGHFNTIALNNITGNTDDGINIHNAYHTQLLNNSISENGEDGIFIQNSTQSLLYGNSVCLNKWDGVHMSRSVNNTLLYNQVMENRWDGVDLHSSSSNTIEYNTIEYNAEYGVNIVYSSNGNLFSNNSCSSLNNYGFYLKDSSWNTLINNTISNHWVGIWLDYSCNNLISNNLLVSNHEAIHASDTCTGNTIRENTMHHNDWGITLYNAYDTEIIENLITQNSQDGIYLIESVNNLISGNDIRLNVRAGIYISVCQFTTIVFNTIDENGVDGVFIENSKNTTLSNNTFSSNDHAGVQIWNSLDDDSGNIITNNSFSEDGIFLYNSYNNAITDNFVNGRTIVYLDGQSDMSVENAGQVLLTHCQNITVSQQNLSDVCVGVEMLYTTDCLISENIFAHDAHGVYLIDSKNNRFWNNDFIDNTEDVYFFCFPGSVARKLNDWDGNFWDNPRVLPKVIVGEKVVRFIIWFRTIPAFTIDWNPGREPNHQGRIGL